jgi:nicotinic acid mononucleotide adenylyltransferase
LIDRIMDAAILRMIEAIHASSRRCVVAVTGGGAQAIALFLDVPGGSRTVLEAVVPYHEQALVDFLGHRPDSFCSAETALAMAVRAHGRARWLVPGEDVLGLGCTASLVTDRPKRGEHRLHVATHSSLGSRVASLTLIKGARDREGEEAVVDAVLLNLLAEACGVSERLTLPLLPGEELQIQQLLARDAWSRFVTGEIASIAVEVDGRMRGDAERPSILLPGSFNPVHEGHWKLAEAAARMAGAKAAFELSITNVDKPPLPPEEIRRRADQFVWRAALWLTRAPTFVEKSALFPGACFVVGADTALRLVQPRYYQDSAERMTEALEAIRTRGCRFLVAGRVEASGRFLELEQLAIPEAFHDLFTAILETVCRVDLSSTQLRQSAEAGNVNV